MRKISLEARVLGSFGVLVGSLVVGSLVLVHVHMTARLRDSMLEQLTTAGRVFEELMATRAESLIPVASVVAELPVLREAARAWEPEELGRAFREINRLVGSEIVILTDRMGVILGRSDRRWRPGEIFDETTSVARALRGHRAASMWVQEGRLYQMVSVPVRTATGLAGTLSVGYGVDAELARDLARLSGNSIVFLVRDRVVAASQDLTDLERENVERLAKRIGVDDPAFDLDGLREGLPAIVAGALIGSGEPVGAYAILRSPVAELAELAALERRLGTGAAVALAAVLAIGFLLSRSITRPLTALSRAAVELGAGKYDSELPAPSGSHEVEDLTRAFETMRWSLQARIGELGEMTAHLEDLVGERTAALEGALADNRRLLGELRRWSEELERKVDERSRELAEAHDVIVQQDRMAAIGRLAAGVAHEINNPLAVLSGFAEGLGDRARDPGLRQQLAFADFPEHLRLIRQEIERLQTIVQKFLGFARSRVPQVERRDLNDLAREVVALLSSHARREGKHLLDDLDPAPLPLDADPEQLKQILLNLTLNGLDAIERGGQVCLRSRIAGGWVEMRVEDDGAGIPREVRERLFEPFFSTKPPEKGTGLGLSLCRDLVRENGGTIEVSAGPGGKGASFTIRFRAAATEGRQAHA